MSATAIDVRYRRLFGYQAGYLPLDRGAVDSFLTDVKAKVTERQAKGVELRSPAVRALAKLLDENLALRHLVKDMIDAARRLAHRCAKHRDIPGQLSAFPTAISDRSRAVHNRPASASLAQVLRHRLLRQPHGFESFLWVVVDRHENDPAFPNGPDCGRPGLDLYAATPAAPANEVHHNHTVARVDESLRDDPELVPYLSCLAMHVVQPRVPLVCGGIENLPRHIDLDLGVRPLDRAEVAAFRSRVDRAHEVHVLVRNKRLRLEECLLLLVGAGLCPLRVSTQRRSGPVDPCPFHLSWVTTPSSWALLRNTRSPGHFIRRG